MKHSQQIDELDHEEMGMDVGHQLAHRRKEITRLRNELKKAQDDYVKIVTEETHAAYHALKLDRDALWNEGQRLRAELVAEQKDFAVEREEHKRTLDQLSAERKAHGETRAERDDMICECIEWGHDRSSQQRLIAGLERKLGGYPGIEAYAELKASSSKRIAELEAAAPLEPRTRVRVHEDEDEEYEAVVVNECYTVEPSQLGFDVLRSDLTPIAPEAEGEKV